MVFEKKEISRYWTFAAIIILGVLVFLLLKPVLISVVSGFILAYLFMPLYKRLVKGVKNKNLAASLVIVLILAVVLVPLWFILPIAINQFFGLFKLSQTIDMTSLIHAVFPSASADFVTQASVTLGALLSKASSGILNSMVSFFVNAPVILLNIMVVGFVFFFGLRDSDKLAEIIKELSPLNKAKEHLLIQQFKDITDSIIYGQLVIGIVQGLLAGVGFLIFGVDKALILTLLTIFCSIIPILGPYIVYIPVAIYMLVYGNAGMAIAYLLYNILIVSTLDNFIRAYIVSKKSRISSAVVFVGMIAGLFMFGIIGLILGPLILAYFLILLQLYREKELSSLFVREENPVIKELEKK